MFRTGSSMLAAQLFRNSVTIVGENRMICLVNHQGVTQVNLDLVRLLSTSAKLVSPSIISRKHVATTSHTATTTALAPSFGLEVGSESLRKPRRLPSNIRFRYCPTKTLGPNQAHSHSTLAFELTHDIADTTAARPLLLIFAWMLSKEGHIEKYRDFWFQRGFDVLSVRTSPTALLLPSLGGARNANIVYDFLSTIQPRYDQVLVHAFSVGGYQLCEFLHRLNLAVENGEEEANRIYNSLKGFIIDSCVFAEDAAPGLSRAITRHPVMQPIVESSIANFLKATKPFTMDRYLKVSSVIFKNERRVPGLMLYSKDDIVSSLNMNNKVVDGWKRNGTLAWGKCWDKSAHVLHYKEHPEEYEQEVDHFLSKLHISKANLK